MKGLHVEPVDRFGIWEGRDDEEGEEGITRDSAGVFFSYHVTLKSEV